MSHNLIERLAAKSLPRLICELEEKSISPFFRTMQSAVGASVQMEDRQVMMFGSNNYLGLAAETRVLHSANRGIHEFGSATTGSRLLNGTVQLHVDIEERLAQWYGTDGALVFTSGYTANVGTIAALLGREDTAVVDAYAHASIIDGVRQSGARLRRFEHNNVDSLRAALAEVGNTSGDVLVIVDGLYSMEGSLSPLADIVAVTKSAGAAIMVDEAHSLGIYGEHRRGWAEECGVLPEVDVLMGSLSKGLGSTGGFIVGSADLIAGLRGAARSLIFSTSATPASVAAANEAIRIVMSEEGKVLAARVEDAARTLTTLLDDKGVKVEGATDHWSPILPVVIGDDEQAIAVWNEILRGGTYVGIAMYPAVPKDRALLRVCVSASHDRDDLVKVADVISNALVTTAVR
ncbi:aminotransferase class I/II-fold pyridoxal phosphate-dependent enzyme [Nocardia iowensis]|uniref:Aminotransferase class I/II-fold pyridoxal phosphate-dependent enzyme n=1 Tax=Nocardia iowensis TaxID=204891 RepID=A0ABX8RNV7_NOCIO|nr:aminotransferase class I/II-fold pyridoxal phosphate-dependent enzyme [Nocardia iowensis]QXN90687.1 aminotransferase class I/II-fold pyridoxal phosphate-dependent enzyme [Nocardia iowensis]